ncbi:MAG TPA: hypothetical protein VLR69_02315 [Thermoanaerobaculia bacterium]|nr:hypothetical protein [Thermoanaerobaculia bacterium]
MSETSADDKQLDRQQAYQHFHIGIYLSLATAIMGASFFSGDKVAGLVWWLRLPLFLSVLLLLFAGACGGMVASQIPSAASYGDFLKDGYGFALPGKDPQGRWPNLDAKTWEGWEHLFFWLAMGMLVLFIAVFLGSPTAVSGHSSASPEVSVRL